MKMNIEPVQASDQPLPLSKLTNIALAPATTPGDPGAKAENVPPLDSSGRINKPLAWRLAQIGTWPTDTSHP